MTQPSATTPAPSLARLAASRAALNPERRAWRDDVLVSALVEVLATTGPLSTDQLLDSVGQMWATGTVSRSKLEDALDLAARSQLVSMQQQFGGADTWVLTEGVREEARQDRAWAERALDAFEAQLLQRVDEIEGAPARPELLQRLSTHLQRGLIAGLEQCYEVAAHAYRPDQLRPIGFDRAAAEAHLRAALGYTDTLQTAREVLTQILNPDDEFGNDIVHLLVVGNLLQGMLASRDLAATRLEEGTRIVLDTSVLVYLADRDCDEEKLLLEVIERSRAAGVEVVVFEHTLEEYARVWEAADREVAAAGERIGELPHVPQTNPFLQAFARARKHDGSISWPRFGATCSSSRSLTGATDA